MIPSRRSPRAGRLLAVLPMLASVHATPTPVHVPRGGGQNPVTDDPATIPTTPPNSNYHNGVPTVAGSEGGFIGLIVGLGILVILTCLGIWWFLRRRRRQREKRRSDAPRPSSGLGAAYDAHTSFPKPGESGLFGQKAAKRGWIQTGEGSKGYDDGIELEGGRKGQGPYLASDSAGAFSSASTIRLAPPEGWKEGFSASREELVSPVGQPSPVVGEVKGEYEMVENAGKEGEEKRKSDVSGKFAGGTRFRESL